MTTLPAYYPYRSAAARDIHFAHYRELAVRRWPVVSEERTVHTSHGRTLVRITGPPGAPPLVLLPGAFATSLMWAPNIQALSGACRTFAIDQIGDAGFSVCDKPVHGLDDLMVWLDEVFDALELGDRVYVVGVSYGAWLAAEYAARFGARTTGVVLLAPAATVLPFGNAFRLRLVLALFRGRRGMRAIFEWMLADERRADPAWFEEEIDRMEHIKIKPRGLPLPRVWTDDQWRALRVPALCLIGEHETIYSPQKALQRLATVAPQVRTELVAGAGHDLTIVQAGLVNRQILDFVRPG